MVRARVRVRGRDRVVDVLSARRTGRFAGLLEELEQLGQVRVSMRVSTRVRARVRIRSSVRVSRLTVSRSCSSSVSLAGHCIVLRLTDASRALRIEMPFTVDAPRASCSAACVAKSLRSMKYGDR